MSAALLAYVSHWGNALLLLPTALGIAVGLALGGRAAVARRWSTWFAAVVVATFATKVAFLGWGIGSRRFDFTGISGHSLLAAAVFPMLAWWLTHDRSMQARRVAIAVGVVVALAIAWTRLALDLHSMSEVVVGLALGFGACAAALVDAGRARDPRVYRMMVSTALAIACVLPLEPGEEAHSLTTRIALALSGREQPFTRDML